MKKTLTEALCKSLVGYNIQNQKSKMELSEDAMVHVMKVIRMFDVLSPNATEREKVNRLFDGLPACLKIHFITNTPAIVGFLKPLKDDVRKNPLREKRKMKNATFPAILLQKPSWRPLLHRHLI